MSNRSSAYTLFPAILLAVFGLIAVFQMRGSILEEAARPAPATEPEIPATPPEPAPGPEAQAPATPGDAALFQEEWAPVRQAVLDGEPDALDRVRTLTERWDALTPAPVELLEARSLGHLMKVEDAARALNSR